MSKTCNGQLKQTRVRLRPIRKWSAAEEKMLIEFLVNNPEIEEPTTDMYYKRFCKESNVNIAWQTVRSKVKNMRSSYLKAKAWEQGEDAATLDKEQIINGLLRKCSNYYDLEAIFGNGITLENSHISTIKTNDIDVTSQTSHDKIPSISAVWEPEMMEIKPDVSAMKSAQVDKDFSLKCVEMGFKENELNFKDKMSVMELILKEKRLDLKQKQLASKESIKISRIKSKEKIKILELEMKERLAKEELRLKYKESYL